MPAAGRLVAVRLIAVLIALLVGCAARPTVTETGAPTAPPAVTASVPAAPIAMLECDGPPSDVGGAGEEISLQVAGGDTPQEALEAFLATSPWVIPRAGYESFAAARDRHAYGFRADDGVKVVVVVSPRFAHLIGESFAAEELRTCASGEFGAEADFGDGRRSWTDPATGHVITDIVGPSHCEWETARLMHLQHADGSLDRQYVRDPAGVLSGWPLHDTYAEDVELPDDARDSGYRSPEGFALWFTESDTAAYVVTPDGVERWPRAVEPIGCA